jgi:cytochrome c553
MIRSSNRNHGLNHRLNYRLHIVLAGCLALVVSLAAGAQESAQQAAAEPNPAPAAAKAATAIAGSAERGEQLAYTCQGCHGVTGYKNAYPTYYVPKISGQSSEYLVAALTGYKTGARKHSTMQAQAQSFSDQDIADIAAYLSSLKKK